MASPISLNPRNPFAEGILNIAKILSDSLLISGTSTEFGKPFIARVNEGKFVLPPQEWPAVDIRFVRKGPAEHKDFGAKRNHVIWPCYYSIRYFHAVQDGTIADYDVTVNLYRIVDLLEYRSDVNHLCPSIRARTENVTQDTSVVLEFPDIGWIVGGAIEYYVPISFQRVEYDGVTARDVAMPTGERH